MSSTSTSTFTIVGETAWFQYQWLCVMAVKAKGRTSVSGLWVAVIAIGVRYAADYGLQPTYPVHLTGGVVVTGASSGIGLHAASTLSDLGYTVFAGVRKQTDGDRLAKEHPGIIPLVLDVTKEKSIAEAVATVTSTLASKGLKLVALVNNAGVQKDMPVELQPPADNRFNFEVNVFGLFDVTHAFLPVLRATGPGARIVNVGSMSGLLAAPGSASYTGSKYAVEGITDSLRLELGDLGISVSLLQPGYVQSQMGVKAHESSAKSYGVTSEEYERYRRTVFDGFYVKDRSQSTDGTASTPATSTTPAIVDAIQSARPKTRYAVAFIDDFPAWLLVSLKAVLPDRVMDFLTLEL